MNHRDVIQKVRAILPEPAIAGYFFDWSSNGRVSPVFITLIPHSDGTVTATYGDMRERIIPVVDDAGNPRVFPDEASACEWAWQGLQEALRPPIPLTAEQKARFTANGEEKRRRRAERNAQWKAEHGVIHGMGNLRNA